MNETTKAAVEKMEKALRAAMWRLETLTEAKCEGAAQVVADARAALKAYREVVQS